MKTIIILLTLLILPNCADTYYPSSSSSHNTGKSVADVIKEGNAQLEANTKSAMGKTKQDVILQWGPPTSIASDGTKMGEVYTYIHSAPVPGGTYTAFAYLYFDEKGICYHTKFNYSFQ